MKAIRLLGTTVAAVALMAAPAWALPEQAPSNQGTAHAPETVPAGPPETPGNGRKPADTPAPPSDPSGDHPDRDDHPGRGGRPEQGDDGGSAEQGDGAADAEQPGPQARAPAKAKAYGVHCRDQSRKRVAGEKGTPFSRCVTAMAKLATGRTASPRAACRDLSRKRVAGEKGTPFSRCVVAGAQLKREQRENDGETAPAPTT